LRRRLARSEAERNKKWFLMPVAPNTKLILRSQMLYTVTLTFNYTLAVTVEQPCCGICSRLKSYSVIAHPNKQSRFIIQGHPFLCHDTRKKSARIC
jgi:hypothetical protein